MTDLTKPEVFIIESLRLDDEEHDRLEGKRIAKMLDLSGKKCKYFYIRSELELEKLMEVFRDSEYRYLHISCHGNKKALSTTFNRLGFHNVGRILNPFINKRRIFVSACEATTMPLASTLMTTTSCYSVMGPYCDINFNDAALFWATFYHLIFQENKGRWMNREGILKHGRAAAKLFKVRAKLFTREGGKIKPYILH
jgi:hypothetical protein